jgi:hypothetical protein
LDFWIEPEYKGRHIRALVQLSRITARYPDYMRLRGIGIEYGAAAGNGFGEVYRGRLGGQKLAIKVLRVLRRMQDTKSMRSVSSSFVPQQPPLNSCSEILTQGCHMATAFAPERFTILRSLLSGTKSPVDVPINPMGGEWKFG